MGGGIAFGMVIIIIKRDDFVQFVQHVPAHVRVGVFVYSDPGRGMGYKNRSDSVMNSVFGDFFLNLVCDVYELGVLSGG